MIKDRLIGLEEICRRTGLSKRQIMGDGTVENPGRIKLGLIPAPHCKDGPYPNSKPLWWESAIDKFVAEDMPKLYPWVPSTPPANDNTPDEGAT